MAGIEIDFKRVPKRALVDALRNAGLGGPNLSRQDKADLVREARKVLRADGAWAASLLAKIEDEVAYRKGAAAVALIRPKGRPA